MFDGQIIWINDKEEYRPKELLITMYKNDEYVQELVTSAEVNWTYHFEDVKTPGQNQYRFRLSGFRKYSGAVDGTNFVLTRLPENVRIQILDIGASAFEDATGYITDENGAVVAEFAGSVVNLELLPGTYTFHETSVPEGFVLGNEFKFVVNGDGIIEVDDANGNVIQPEGNTLSVVIMPDLTPSDPEDPEEPEIPEDPEDPKDPDDSQETDKPVDTDDEGKSDEPTNPEDSEKPSKPGDSEKTDGSNKPSDSGKTDGSEKSDKPSDSGKTDGFDDSEKSERPSRPEGWVMPIASDDDPTEGDATDDSEYYYPPVREDDQQSSTDTSSQQTVNYQQQYGYQQYGYQQQFNGQQTLAVAENEKSDKANNDNKANEKAEKENEAKEKAGNDKEDKSKAGTTDTDNDRPTTPNASDSEAASDLATAEEMIDGGLIGGNTVDSPVVIAMVGGMLALLLYGIAVVLQLRKNPFDA